MTIGPVVAVKAGVELKFSPCARAKHATVRKGPGVIRGWRGRTARSCIICDDLAEVDQQTGCRSPDRCSYSGVTRGFDIGHAHWIQSEGGRRPHTERAVSIGLKPGRSVARMHT